MAYVFPPPPVVSLEVVGTPDRFPVRRVYCVGRNYAAHIREMGLDPAREPPFFFQKPADAVAAGDGVIAHPPATNDLQHEVELVVAMGRGGADIPVADAMDHVFAYGVGVDLTRRDLQIDARNKGRPWETGKSFDRSGPVGPLLPASRAPSMGRGRIWLSVNGALRQEGDLGQLIWSVPETLAALSRLFRLEPGDLVFTGTPSGVGALRPGDTVRAGIEGLPDLALTIGQRT